MQDLYKTELLCKTCESILNESETFFANHIFHPFKNNSLKNIPEDDHFGRFAISISLRVLWMMKFIEHPIVQRWPRILKELEKEWIEYLLRKPGFKKGKNSHHIILCNENLLASGLKNNPNLLINILRTSTYYIFEKFEKVYLFANLAGVQVISMVHPINLPVSSGTEVYPNQTFGRIVPAGIGWGGYFQNLIELSNKCNDLKMSISDSYLKLMEKALEKNKGNFPDSEDFRILLMQQAILKSIINDDE